MATYTIFAEKGRGPVDACQTARTGCLSVKETQANHRRIDRVLTGYPSGAARKEIDGMGRYAIR